MVVELVKDDNVC